MIKSLFKYRYSLFLLFAFTCSCNQQYAQEKYTDDIILSYVCDPNQQDIKMYWRNDSGEVFGNIGTLISKLGDKNNHLILAMNGGMYLEDQSPQGLYIENSKTIKATNTIKSAYGNFYMQPNGIFYIHKNGTAGVCKTDDIQKVSNIQYATQSGPMLVHNGRINAHFNKNSSSTYIRNGLGILPDGKVLFAISSEKLNLYRFADFFKQNGCENALYLDGFVSRIYLPERNIRQTDGAFGVIIAVFEQ